MKIKPIDDWRAVLKHAWSIKLGALSALFYVLNLLVELGSFVSMIGDFLPRKVFVVLSVVCALAGFLSRFIKQPKLEAARANHSTTT